MTERRLSRMQRPIWSPGLRIALTADRDQLTFLVSRLFFGRSVPMTNPFLTEMRFLKYRLDAVNSWPDSARKRATIEAIELRLQAGWEISGEEMPSGIRSATGRQSARRYPQHDENFRSI